MEEIDLNRLSVIIPCFNEENILENTIKRIRYWCKFQDLDYEIIIVNNNSIDNTEKIARKLTDKNVFLVNECKQGKGHAVKKGLIKSKFNNLLILDADLSTDIKHLNLDWLNNNDSLVVGSRPLGSEVGTPLIRKIYGKVLNYLIRINFQIEIKDTQCGFKFISTNKLDEIIERLEFGGFIYDLDLILACKGLSFELLEIPVEYDFNKDSSVNLLLDPLIIFKDLIKLKIKY